MYIFLTFIVLNESYMNNFPVIRNGLEGIMKRRGMDYRLVWFQSNLVYQLKTFSDN